MKGFKARLNKILFFLKEWKLLYILKWFQEYILTPLLSILFPSNCPVCLQPLEKFHLGGICLNCWASIKLIRKPKCSKCGFYYESLINTHKNKDVVCGRCQVKKYYFSYARSFGEYSSPLKEIIHHYKFNKNAYLSRIFADLVLKAMNLKKRYGNIDAIIAVPLHRKRKKKRGFNQSYLIALQIGKRLHIQVEKRVLFRLKNSVPQMDLPANKRERNVKGAFEVKNVQKIRGKKILLIDDVMTTGATVNECARVLKRAGSKDVAVLTIAHTPINRD